MERNEDRALVAAAAEGDERAFEELYARHKGWTLDVALRFTGDASGAQDVVQEVFLYLLRKLPDLELVAPLRSLLYPVVRHLARDQRVRSGRLKSDEEALAVLPGSLETTALEDGRTLLAGALAGLPETQREPLFLRFADGLSLAETAAALEIPVGTVKSRIHSALGALREDPRTARFFEREA